MMKLTAKEIESAVNGTVARGANDAVFTGVSIDSRTVAPGNIFFAIRGPRMDGHDFIADSALRGAPGAVVSGNYAPSAELPENFVLIRVKDTHEALRALARSVRLSWNGKIVAVTGSVGKTTTKEFAYQLIKTQFRAYRTPGNFNNLFGLPLALLGMSDEHEVGIFEMGMSAAGEIAEMCRIALPETGILTNVAPVHLEFFSSLEGIAEAKGELVQGLNPYGTLIYNADDALVCRLAGRFSGKKISFGRRQNADVRASDIEIQNLDAVRFRLSCRGEALEASLPFAGEHYVDNVLPGVGLAVSLGMTLGEIVPVLKRLRQAEMRGRVLRYREGFALIDDSYNSSPRALMSMIGMLASVPGFTRRILFAGEMLELGQDAPRLHFECGEFAAERGVDVVVGVAGNAGEIVRAACRNGNGKMTSRFFETSEGAAEYAAEIVRPGDLLLVKGSRGVHMEKVTEAVGRNVNHCVSQ